MHGEKLVSIQRNSENRPTPRYLFFIAVAILKSHVSFKDLLNKICLFILFWCSPSWDLRVTQKSKEAGRLTSTILLSRGFGSVLESFAQVICFSGQPRPEKGHQDFEIEETVDGWLSLLPKEAKRGYGQIGGHWWSQFGKARRAAITRLWPSVNWHRILTLGLVKQWAIDRFTYTAGMLTVIMRFLIVNEFRWQE